MTNPVSFVPNAATTSAPAAAAGNRTSGNSGASTTSDRLQLDPQAFLQLLVAQLQYQDPSNPVDTSSFMQQTATLSQVQTMNAMATTLTSLANAQQAQAATDLIGKSITYADSSGVQKSGVVTSASLLASGATLSVGGVDVPLTSVLGVSAAAPSATP
jgi:flagellar basal-body rod modification protein FlgD